MEEIIREIKEKGIIKYLLNEVDTLDCDKLAVVLQTFLGVVLQNYNELDIEELENLIIEELEEI